MCQLYDVYVDDTTALKRIEAVAHSRKVNLEMVERVLLSYLEIELTGVLSSAVVSGTADVAVGVAVATVIAGAIALAPDGIALVTALAVASVAELP